MGDTVTIYAKNMYGNTYQGKYKVKKPEKYVGDPDNVTYRSLWERACFVWAERNPDVVKWSSEEVIIPYFDEGLKRNRRYHIDLQLELRDGTKLLVEIKPHKQTKPPTKRGKKRERYLEESMTYITNMSKWKAARALAEAKGWKFVIWDEKILKKMGILKF